MVEIGLLRIESVSGQPWQDGGEVVYYLHVTPKGHDFLTEFRANTWGKVLLRRSLNFFEGFFQSVLTPVAVAVLTVLLMDYFGLGG